MSELEIIEPGEAEVVKPANDYKEAQRVGFKLLSLVVELVREYYPDTTPNNKDTVEMVEEILSELVEGYSSLGLVMGPDPEPEYNGVDMEIGFLLSKLTRAASNFFIIVMSYPESWEDNYLNIDLDNLHLYLTIFKRQELQNGNNGVEEASGVPELPM